MKSRLVLTSLLISCIAFLAGFATQPQSALAANPNCNYADCRFWPLQITTQAPCNTELPECSGIYPNYRLKLTVTSCLGGTQGTIRAQAPWGTWYTLANIAPGVWQHITGCFPPTWGGLCNNWTAVSQGPTIESFCIEIICCESQQMAQRRSVNNTITAE